MKEEEEESDLCIPHVSVSDHFLRTGTKTAKLLGIDRTKVSQTAIFLGAKTPLEIASVIYIYIDSLTKKFQIVTISLEMYRGLR